MSVKKTAYKMTTPEQAPLFMCAGKENEGKVPKVDRNGFITEFVEITGGGEPDEYIKNIVKNDNTYTAERKNGEVVEWIIPDTTELAPKANAALTGTTSVENIVVDGDITAKSGTPVTDFNMSNAKTFVIPSISLVDPAEATSGTLTDLQLSTLQSTECAYIEFNGEKYYLYDKEHTAGSLGYGCVTYENSKFTLKTITITISTKGWVLTSQDIGGSEEHIYIHNLSITYKGSSSTNRFTFKFNIYLDNNTKLTTSTVASALSTYFKSVLPDSTNYSLNSITTYSTSSNRYICFATSSNWTQLRTTYQTTFGSQTIENFYVSFDGSTSSSGTWTIEEVSDTVVQLS